MQYWITWNLPAVLCWFCFWREIKCFVYLETSSRDFCLALTCMLPASLHWWWQLTAQHTARPTDWEPGRKEEQTEPASQSVRSKISTMPHRAGLQLVTSAAWPALFSEIMTREFIHHNLGGNFFDFLLQKVRNWRFEVILTITIIADIMSASCQLCCAAVGLMWCLSKSQD